MTRQSFFAMITGVFLAMFRKPNKTASASDGANTFSSWVEISGETTNYVCGRGVVDLEFEWYEIDSVW